MKTCFKRYEENGLGGLPVAVIPATGGCWKKTDNDIRPVNLTVPVRMLPNHYIRHALPLIVSV